MDAIEFVSKFPDYLQTIKKVTKEEYYPVLESMEEWEPHDLVKPDSWFQDENSAIGFVYRLFLREVKNSEKKPQLD